MSRGAAPRPRAPTALQERLDNLEQTVAALAREVRALRSAVDRLDRLGRDAVPAPESPGPAPVAADVAADAVGAGTLPTDLPRQPDEPDAPRPLHPDPRIAADIQAERREAERRMAERRAGVARRSLDFESLIGRYGTLALASLTILLGAGAFLSWAIAQGKIGPELRVILGALGAAVVAAVGWRLRRGGSMRFGSTLLALALALVHVDAWGAGPSLQLVPSPVYAPSESSQDACVTSLHVPVSVQHAPVATKQGLGEQLVLSP